MKPSTSPCDDVLEMLPLHVGGDLEPASLRVVALHIERCPDCRAAEARITAARDALRAGLSSEVRGGGPALWPSIRAELRREGVLAPSPRPRLAGRILAGPGRRAAAAFAVAAAVAVLVVPRFLGAGAGHVVDLVENDPGAGNVLVDAPQIADLEPSATSSPEAPRRNGLVPIRNVGDLLQSQLGPGADPSLKLTSSASSVR